MKVYKKNNFLRITLSDNYEEILFLNAIAYSIEILNMQASLKEAKIVSKEYFKELKKIIKKAETNNLYDCIDNLVYVMSVNICITIADNTKFVLEDLIKENTPNKEALSVFKSIMDILLKASKS